MITTAEGIIYKGKQMKYNLGEKTVYNDAFESKCYTNKFCSKANLISKFGNNFATKVPSLYINIIYNFQIYIKYINQTETK